MDIALNFVASEWPISDLKWEYEKITPNFLVLNLVSTISTRPRVLKDNSALSALFRW